VSTNPFDLVIFVHSVIRTSTLLIFLMDDMVSLSVLLLTSMTNSESIYELVFSGLLPSSSVKHLLIIHGLNLFFVRGSFDNSSELETLFIRALVSRLLPIVFG